MSPWNEATPPIAIAEAPAARRTAADRARTQAHLPAADRLRHRLCGHRAGHAGRRAQLRQQRRPAHHLPAWRRRVRQPADHFPRHERAASGRHPRRHRPRRRGDPPPARFCRGRTHAQRPARGHRQPDPAVRRPRARRPHAGAVPDHHATRLDAAAAPARVQHLAVRPVPRLELAGARATDTGLSARRNPWPATARRPRRRAGAQRTPGARWRRPRLIARLPRRRRRQTGGMESQRPPRRPAGPRVRTTGKPPRMDAGLAQRLRPRPRGRHRATGPLDRGSPRQRRTLDPARARPAARAGQRRGALPPVHAHAGADAMNAVAGHIDAIARKRPLLGTRAFGLLCLTMAAVLALHAPHLPWWLSVPLALVLGLRWWQRRRHGTRIAWWVRLPLTLALPFAVIATYGTIFGRRPGCALAVGLLEIGSASGREGG